MTKYEGWIGEGLKKRDDFMETVMVMVTDSDFDLT